MTYASIASLTSILVGLVTSFVPNGIASESAFVVSSYVERSPAIIGPATDSPVGENAEMYRDYLENDVRLEGSDS